MFELTPFTRRANDLMNLDLWRDLPFFRDSRNMTERPFRTDIKDEGDHYLLESELPGFDRDNIKVKVEDGYLTVRAERKEETDEKDDKGRFIRRERSYGVFERSFDVSQIETDKITAEYKDGILSLKLPKKDETKPNSSEIEIK
ncbi:MAG: Hsp20/alpha crystallin family protein [Clostridiales bacterium]|nr:Hsp20/alpha crystallin family protein [Clostridiales bacterium]